MADRLRAEAEEELTALRAVHKDVERELAAAQQRQKEADVQLVTLRGELKESRQKLAALTQAQNKTDAQASCQEPERPNTEANNTSDGKEGTQKGTDRAVYRLGRELTESRGENDVMKNVASEEARTGCKGVAKRYLRNVTNEDRSGEELRSTETRRTVPAERSRCKTLFYNCEKLLQEFLQYITNASRCVGCSLVCSDSQIFKNKGLFPALNIFCL